MHKVLLLLGMLLGGPLYGYQLHQIVRAHGELYADLKKANLYYLLERLAKEGYLETEVETGARGIRGERVIYTLTEQGWARFYELLRETLVSYELVHTGIETAVVFLSQLPPAEGMALLQERRQVIAQRHAQVVSDVGDPAKNSPLMRIAGDHLVSLVDAELAWIDRSLAYLREVGWADQGTTASSQSSHAPKDGTFGKEDSFNEEDTAQNNS